MSGTEQGHSDEVLLGELDRLLDMADPVPPGLVERIQFAVALENLHVEVARWERADALAGVRSTDVGTVTFTVDDLTVMVTFNPSDSGYRMDGWLGPGGPHRVEVRVAGHPSTATTADHGGRFVVDDVPRGTLQIVVQLSNGEGVPSRTVVTPTLVL
jgi:hypothetical protein